MDTGWGRPRGQRAPGNDPQSVLPVAGIVRNDLASHLSTRSASGVHVRVGGAGTDGGEKLLQVAGFEAQGQRRRPARRPTKTTR